MYLPLYLRRTDLGQQTCSECSDNNGNVMTGGAVLRARLPVPRVNEAVALSRRPAPGAGVCRAGAALSVLHASASAGRSLTGALPACRPVSLVYFSAQ